jgi:hypothetical protein
MAARIKSGRDNARRDPPRVKIDRPHAISARGRIGHLENGHLESGHLESGPARGRVVRRGSVAPHSVLPMRKRGASATAAWSLS